MKAPKHVSGPALTINQRGGSRAWWNFAAQPGELGYVEPVITANTKVTIGPAYTEHSRWSNTHLQTA
jgi:hypothetical protein